MSDHVYSVTEVYGSSHYSIEDAVSNAVETAGQTIRNLEWFEISELRGDIRANIIPHFQVGVNIGFGYDRSG